MKGITVAGVYRGLNEVPAFAPDIQTQVPRLLGSKQGVLGDTQHSYVDARDPGNNSRFLQDRVSTCCVLCSCP